VINIFVELMIRMNPANIASGVFRVNPNTMKSSETQVSTP
jgi:hypothetical protein